MSLSFNTLLLIIFTAYFLILFFIAYSTDKQQRRGRRIISHPLFFSLTIAVYCTDWTFYGSVGIASKNGLNFLPIYIGATLMYFLGGSVLKKISRICKTYSITSISDFISSRYGKSSFLAGLVTVMAFVGILPYIALQLKAIGTTFTLLAGSSQIIVHPHTNSSLPVDPTFVIAIILIIFVIGFGARHLDTTVKHDGLINVIAFESVIKLTSFLAAGIFIVYGMYNGFSDIFTQADNAGFSHLWSIEQKPGAMTNWFILILLSFFAILLLPRQFQMGIIENLNEKHYNSASWQFPVYLLLINFFVLPIALAGNLRFSGAGIDADTFMLMLPLSMNQELVAWFVFFGGLSAATGMIIIETMALSNMFSNSLVLPIIVRFPLLQIREGYRLDQLLLMIRWLSVAVVILASYYYFRLIANNQTLVSTGLISFVAVAQFAPALLGGIYWKQANKKGALAGLIAGFIIWFFTLPFAQLIQAGYFPKEILSEGILGIGLLIPGSLFGVNSLDPISHATLWSLGVNSLLFMIISLSTRQTPLESSQANLFTDVMRYSVDDSYSNLWKGQVSRIELKKLLQRYLGEMRADTAFYDFFIKYGEEETPETNAKLVQHAEKLLSGTIGSVSARIILSSLVIEEPLQFNDVIHILDATQQVIEYSQKLEQKSDQLQDAKDRLQQANMELTQLDRLKDDFIATVTHELRTPLTSIRAFSEILFDNPDMELEKRTNFLNLIVKEAERLSRLINEVLDIEKLESGDQKWEISRFSINQLVREAVNSVGQLAQQSKVEIETACPGKEIMIHADRDRITQVVINLLSNAIKFTSREKGMVWVKLKPDENGITLSVIDNGKGILPENRELVFEKFRQINDENKTEGIPGSGLGLSICKAIIENHQGTIGIKDTNEKGAHFYFTLPLKWTPRS